MGQTVLGVFDTKQRAMNAKSALENSQFKADHIDVSTFGENGVRSKNYREEEHGSSIGNFFADLFTDDDDNVKRYRDVSSKGTTVTVHTTSMDQAKRAAEIMDNYGAINADERYQQYCDKTFDASTIAATASTETDKINVIKEDLKVGKRELETGGVIVKSRIVEKPVQETLRLREEKVYVTRTDVDRPATAADFETETIRMKETAEEAVVSKDARVVEEIEVNKDVSERTEKIKETVRETKVDIEKIKGDDVKKYKS